MDFIAIQPRNTIAPIWQAVTAKAPLVRRGFAVADQAKERVTGADYAS